MMSSIQRGLSDAIHTLNARAPELFMAIGSFTDPIRSCSQVPVGL